MTNLIGGTIGTLAAAHEQFAPIRAKVDTTVDDINKAVRQIRDDAGWSGDAATAFEFHWEIASLAADVVGSFTQATADVLKSLGDDLTETEHGLYTAIDEARSFGVTVGADGRPPVPPGPVLHADAWDDYGQLWQGFQQAALGFRLTAAADMLEIAKEAASLLQEPRQGLGADAKVELIDYLRGVLWVKYDVKDYLQKQVDRAQAKYDTRHAAWETARDEGKGISVTIKDARSDALRKLTKLQEKLSVKLAKKTPIADVLNTNLGNLLDRLPGRLGELLRDTKWSGLRILGEVPVVDIAAAGVTTFFQASDDIEKGMDPVAAYGFDGGANLIGVGAGVWTGIGVSAGIGAIGGAPLVAVAGAAIIGGAVAIGVGDLFYEGFHEDWGEDIHKDGAMGLVYGTGHVFANAGEDLADMGKSIWHGVTSIFD